MSVLDGPGEGTWSVFASKVVEQRDELRDRLSEARAEVERLRTVVEAAKAFSHATRHLDGDASWKAEGALHAAVDALTKIPRGA